jgi:ABC-2 type transport system ATP-binding protein
MIHTAGLTKRYGARAVVDALSLEVAQGAVFGFLGPNGAGKSTTLKMLCGFLKPTSGELSVAGLSPIKQRRELQRVIGFMPQTFGLYTYLTVRENLQFYGDLHLPSRRAVRERLAEVMEATGLGPHAGLRAEQLSGGWRQRLALACAILHRPRLLFLDEPTAGVDPVSRRIFWDLIQQLNDGGVTIFVTTHYMEEVERCTRIGLISQGRLRISGAPQELRAEAARAQELLAVDCDDHATAFAALHGAEGLRDAYLYGERIHLAWAPGARGIDQTAERLQRAGVPVRAVEPRRATMEDVFVAAATENGS